MAVQPAKPNNRIILIIGILCAALAFGGVIFLLRQGGSSTTPTHPVLVARTDIDAGAPLTVDAVQVQSIPDAVRPADAFSDPSAISGKIAASRIAANTPIVPGLLQGGGSGAGTSASTGTPATSTTAGLDASISKGHVALAIPAAISKEDFTTGDLLSVGYYIQPGDHIDILIDPGQPSGLPVGARFSFQDVRVLRVGTGTASAAAPAPSASAAPAPAAAVAPTVYIVEMQRAQAEELTAMLTRRTPQTVLKYVLRPQSEWGKPDAPNYEDSGSPAVPTKQDSTATGDSLSKIFTR